MASSKAPRYCDRDDLTATWRWLDEVMTRRCVFQSSSAVVLQDTDLIALENVVRTVQDTQYYHSSTFARAELDVLSRVLRQWPAEHVFPALDLLRLVLVHPRGPEMLGDTAVNQLAAEILSIGLRSSSGAEEVPIATRMLALRVLANMFLQDNARAAVLAHKDEVSRAEYVDWLCRLCSDWNLNTVTDPPSTCWVPGAPSQTGGAQPRDRASEVRFGDCF